MSNDNKNVESFFIENSRGEYFCVSPVNGLYFTEDVSDSNIVDGASLEIKDSKEDTIRQIAEQVKLKQGTQFDRKDLFQHPNEKAWLCVEKTSTPDKQRDENNKLVRVYQAFWSRKFKRVSAVSKSREKCQGNASWRQGSQSVKEANKKALAERKKRLASAQETARKLNFDPMKRLALYAMGDSEALGLKEDVKASLQLKSIEIYLKYSHQQMKPYSPQEIERLKGSDSGPKINIVLPSDGSENKDHVIEHKNTESLEYYLKNGKYDHSEDLEEVSSETEEDFEQIRSRLELPDED